MFVVLLQLFPPALHPLRQQQKIRMFIVRDRNQALIFKRYVKPLSKLNQVIYWLIKCFLYQVGIITHMDSMFGAPGR